MPTGRTTRRTFYDTPFYDTRDYENGSIELVKVMTSVNTPDLASGTIEVVRKDQDQTTTATTTE